MKLELRHVVFLFTGKAGLIKLITVQFPLWVLILFWICLNQTMSSDSPKEIPPRNKVTWPLWLILITITSEYSALEFLMKQNNCVMVGMAGNAILLKPHELNTNFLQKWNQYIVVPPTIISILVLKKIRSYYSINSKSTVPVIYSGCNDVSLNSRGYTTHM